MNINKRKGVVLSLALAVLTWATPGRALSQVTGPIIYGPIVSPAVPVSGPIGFPSPVVIGRPVFIFHAATVPAVSVLGPTLSRPSACFGGR